MATYVVLGTFTEQGVRNAKDSPKRADAFKEMAKKCGATVKDLYWAQGQYDIVPILEAPDDLSATALSLSVGALGNIRTQTLRAFSAADMQGIIGKMGGAGSGSVRRPSHHIRIQDPPVRAPRLGAPAMDLVCDVGELARDQDLVRRAEIGAP